MKIPLIYKKNMYVFVAMSDGSDLHFALATSSQFIVHRLLLRKLHA